MLSQAGHTERPSQRRKPRPTGAERARKAKQPVQTLQLGEAARTALTAVVTPEDYRTFVMVCRSYTMAAIDTLVQLMGADQPPPVRAVAAKTLLEHGWGKAPQEVRISQHVQVTELTTIELEAMAQCLLNSAHPAQAPNAPAGLAPPTPGAGRPAEKGGDEGESLGAPSTYTPPVLTTESKLPTESK